MRQIERVNVATAVIQQCINVAIAGDFLSCSVGVQSFELGNAITLPVLFLRDQRVVLLVVQRDEDTAGAIVAFDGVLFNTAANDLCALKHHAAEQSGAFRAVTLIKHIDAADIGVDQLAAVAAAGTKADAGGIKYYHVIAGFYQKQCR